MEPILLTKQDGGYLLQEDGTSRLIALYQNPFLILGDVIQNEKTALQQKLISTNYSLYDLRQIFYAGNAKMQSQNDAVRTYLHAQTGLTTIQSLSDLWRQFFIAKGISNQVSLSDMAKLFFENVGF